MTKWWSVILNLKACEMGNKALAKTSRDKSRKNQSQNELQPSWSIKWKKERFSKYREVRGREGQRHK